MFIVRYRKIFFTISSLLILASLYGIWSYGLNLSTDFVGGTLTEVSYSAESMPDKSEIESAVSTLSLGGFSVRPAGEDHYIIRTRELGSEDKVALIGALGNPVLERQSTIGPVAGAELKSKSVKAIAVVIVMILLFVTFAFRKVSKPVSSWKYALATILALAHDVIVPTGAFVYLGYLYGIEIDLLFVSGLLAILGFSVHDTIVVFDRVRETLRTDNGKLSFEEVVGKSLVQTMARSINTSLTLFITLLALYFFGSSATKDFSLLLIIGTIAGAYSSIFIAAPLLVTFYKLQKGSK